MRNLRHRAAAVVGGLLLATSMATMAGGQEPPPTVTVSGVGGSIDSFTGCDGVTDSNPFPGDVTIRRSGDTTGPLSVDVSYGGTLTPGVDYEALPDPVVVVAGATSTQLPVASTRPGTLTVTIEPGSGYVVGEPATSTLEYGTIAYSADCIPEGDEVQTIEVGTTPEPIDIYGTYTSPLSFGFLTVEGDVPPGLTYNMDGTWEGAAAEVGTFDFLARYCLGPGATELCYLDLPIRVIVVPVGGGDPPPPATPPASPISGAARFTG